MGGDQKTPGKQVQNPTGGGADGGSPAVPSIGKTTLTFPNMIDRDRTKATIDQKDKGGVKPVFSTVRSDFGDTTGSEGVSFQAPTVKMSADVHLVKDCIPDPAQVEVGWVQVVESSRRVALYEKDGKVVHREVAGITESVRDVLNSKDALAGGTRFFNPGVEKKIALSESVPSGKVEMSDGPSHGFPIQMGGGTLSGMTGQDNFRTSLMAAANGRMEPIKTFEWHVPWDCHIAFGTDKKNKGKKTVSSPDGKSLDINRNAALDGSDAKDRTTNGLTAMAQFSSYDSESFASDTLAKSPAKFFNDLATAKQLDPESYWHMIAALWKSPKQFKLSIKVDDADDKDEQFDVEFVGDGNVKHSGSSMTAFAALGHMVYHPEKLPRPIEVKINGTTIATMKNMFESPTGSGTITKRKPAHMWSSKDFRFTYTLKFE